MLRRRDAFILNALLFLAIELLLLSNSAAFLSSPLALHHVPYQRVSSRKLADDPSFSSSDMDSLRNRIEQQKKVYYEFLSSDDEDDIRPETVFIIQFNFGTEAQGVHTIEFPKGSGSNLLLGFESRDECENFAEMLKQDNLQFQDAELSEAPFDDLEKYCIEMGMPIKVVPKGTNLKPPTENVDDFSYDLQMKAQELLEQQMKTTEKNKDENEGAWE